MTTKKPKADQGRPTEQTPCGLLYTDTPAYARYAEARQVRDWHKTFLDDLEHLRIDGATAIKRIDEFEATAKPVHKNEYLPRIRAALAGATEIGLGRQLTALRLFVSNHWDYVVSCIAQDCERPPTGHERPYDGPVPRKSGDHTPAFGYHRALTSGRY